MKVRIMYLIFRDLPLAQRDVPKIRGYLTGRYPEITELHNHLPGDKFDYRYPVIQYRLIDGYAAILALGRGIEILSGIFSDVDNIRIGDQVIETSDKEIIFKTQEFGVSADVISYKFLSPWAALSEKNYPLCKAKSEAQQNEFLCHLLRENLKTISKGFAYTIEDVEAVKVTGQFIRKTVQFKNSTIICFGGGFQTNFHLPEYIGLGKSVARGFGVVTPG